MKLFSVRAFRRALLISTLGMLSLAAAAVTPKEMEQARTIAATLYLRYANNHSDYLDKVNVTTLSELQTAVSSHEIDRKNLSVFIGKGQPPDFAQWDKEKLVKYWSGEFFQRTGLKSEGEQMRNGVIRSRISQMTVTPPQAEQPMPEQQPGAEEQMPPQQEPQPVAVPEDIPMPTAPVAATDTTSTQIAEIEAGNQKAKNSMGIYIVVLIVLIIIVIGLVIFGVKMMRGGKSSSTSAPASPPSPTEAPEEQMVLEESFIDTKPSPIPTPQPAPSQRRLIEEQEAEIARLRRQVEDALRAEADAHAYAEKLALRVGELEVENERLRRATAAMPQNVTPGAPRRTLADQYSPRYGGEQYPRPSLNDNYQRAEPEAVQPRRAPGAPLDHPVPRGQAPNLGWQAEPEYSYCEGERVIYLGRANRQKIFVRADKKFTVGKTIYRLTTTNGLSGTFVVDANPAVAEWVSLDPVKAFCGAAELPSMAGSEDFTRIVTDSPGTAIFEDGCWKVVRPAAVHLE